jgi:hypothetical protein
MGVSLHFFLPLLESNRKQMPPFASVGIPSISISDGDLDVFQMYRRILILQGWDSLSFFQKKIQSRFCTYYFLIFAAQLLNRGFVPH